jgi:hypothetical protein
MTLPARRTTAALLQVDAIRTRLDSTAALDEIARYLLAEFSELSGISFYRVEPPPVEFAGGTPVEGRATGELPPAVDEAARLGRRAEDPVTRESAVPVVEEGRTVGVLLARAATGSLDVSDGRFLTEVARRSAGPLGSAARRLL